MVMLNGAPPPEETPEVLLKIHLRTPDHRKFFNFFLLLLFLSQIRCKYFRATQFFWEKRCFLRKLQKAVMGRI